MSQSFRLARKCNDEGYKFIYDSIEQSILDNTKAPLMIGKIGANELLVICQTFGILQNQIDDYSLCVKQEGCIGAGIFPPTKESFIIFVKTYLEAIKSMNIMASWNDNILHVEEHVWNNYIMKAKDQYKDTGTNSITGIVELKILESFYTEPKYWWNTLYENKTILIIP